MSIIKINQLSSVAYLFFSFLGTTQAGTMGPSVLDPGSIYIGGFGGGGELSSSSLSQKGTAFYTEAKGGPLAVNATGFSKQTSEWIAGGHVGYRWSDLQSHLLNQNWSVAPAVELEGYYIGGATIAGEEINNDTARLTEHDFMLSYPSHTGVFLVNALLNVTHSYLGKFHPYVGVGAGVALFSVTNATSVQTTPSEPDVNHYNSDPNDQALVMAAQPKIGLSYQISKYTSLFGEYRFLYLSGADLLFGSTVSTNHVATSNWSVQIGNQYYNIGTVGIQYDL